MYQTLFVIPREIAGIDVFGIGWALLAWCLISVGLIAFAYRRSGWSGDTRSQIGVSIFVALAIIFVLPNLMDEQLGGVAIRGYGAMLLIAVVSGVGLTMWRARRVGLDPEVILSLGTWFFVTGLIGARLFYVIEYWPRFQKATIGETLAGVVNLTQGGLVVYGSLLAGGAAFIVFVYKYHLPGLALADLIAPGVILGVGLGRLGCFMNGCCYGGQTDLPWAVQFPPESPAFLDQVEHGKLYVQGLTFKGSGDAPPIIDHVEPGSPAAKQGLAPGQLVVAVGGVKVVSAEQAQLQLLRYFGDGQRLEVTVAGQAPKQWTLAAGKPRSLPVHPTQLYSLFDGALLCLLLLLYEPYKRRDGELAALLLTLHPISRFLLEIIRVDESAIFGTGMSISQNISIGIFLAGIALWIYLLRRPRGCVWEPQLALAA